MVGHLISMMPRCLGSRCRGDTLAGVLGCARRDLRRTNQKDYLLRTDCAVAPGVVMILVGTERV